jgi:UDP-N-acetylmuramoyl-L-alanyl-D-glutamate--2,6-diaminopimelate ligase
LCAIAAILSFGFSLQEIVQKALKGVLPIPGRLERVEPQGPHIHKLRNLPTVLIDYAHTPDALEKAIKICKLILAQRQQGKLLTVFGCGGDRDKDKRPLMGKLACELSDVVIVTSDNPRSEDPLKIIEEICVVDAAHCFREADRKKAIELAIKLGKKFDLILIAGKGHEDYQIIGDLKYPFSDAKIASQALFKEKN